MYKFKSILPLILSNLRNGRLQLYCKAVSRLEPALCLTDALGTKTEDETVKTTSNQPVEPNLKQTEKTILHIQSEINPQTNIISSSDAGRNKSKECKNKVPPKGKKGKKCGQTMPPPPPRNPGSCLEDKCGMFEIPKHNSKKWRTISYALVPFALGLCALVFATKKEHPEPDYIPYEYMYIRTKRFPWGDGKKSLFHGPNNLIPEEEEERLDKKEKENPPDEKKDGSDGKRPRYKKSVCEKEEKLKLREQHAKEELERRKKRHEEERAKKKTNCIPN